MTGKQSGNAGCATSVTEIEPGFTAVTEFKRGKPPNNVEVFVQFRSFTDWQHRYTASQLVWEDRGYAFDVIAVKRA